MNEAELLFPEYTHDPLAWVIASYPWGTEYFNQSGPLKWQREILDYIGSELRNGAANKGPIKIAVASGHGIGKSALVSMIMMWGLSTCVDTRIITTANTEKQLLNKTWPELGTWINRAVSKNLFIFNATSLIIADKDHAKTWRADAIPWSKETTESFAGLHNKGKRIILIFDEASAIPNQIWEVAEGAMTDKDTEIIWIAFGNPTRNTGKFRECFGAQRHRWYTKQIDSRTVSITNKNQIQQWLEDYGEESDFFRVRVRGEFPNQSVNQFISFNDVYNAMNSKNIGEKHDPIVMGVDVARFGDDETVICVRQGKDAKTFKWKVYKNLDTMQVAGQVAGYANEFTEIGIPIDKIFVDSIGVGSGVADRLRELGWPVIDVNSARASPDETIGNLRAYMWMRMRDWLKNGGSIPKNKTLRDDLIGPEYYYTTSGKLMIEKKEDMKKRGIASPNYADALALTFSMNVPLKTELTSSKKNNFVIGCDYDPLEY